MGQWCENVQADEDIDIPIGLFGILLETLRSPPLVDSPQCFD